MKARTLILTTATLAAFVVPAAQAATGTSRAHHSRAAQTRAVRLERAAYAALAQDGLYGVAVHTILAG
jgi:hypothetical protein